MSKVIAILCSDLHIGTCPSARSAEKNWLDAMARSLREMIELSDKHNAVIVCTGDVVDRYGCSPEIINFAAQNLPEMYCVVGNHDLPFHRTDQLSRSAYYSLILTGNLINLERTVEIETNCDVSLHLHPFPWGSEIKPLDRKDKTEGIHLAVIHRYVWEDGKGHPGAREEDKASNLIEILKGYDVVVTGDNHSGFIYSKPGYPTLMNCGTFFRRKSDERDYRPQIGLLHGDGSILLHYLDVSQDVFVEETTKGKSKSGLLTGNEKLSTGFLESIRGLGSDSLDFRESVKRYMEVDDTDSDVRAMVLEAIDSK